MRYLSAFLIILWLCTNAVAQPMNAYTPFSCTASVVYDASTSGATELVAAAAGKRVYVCGYVLFTGAVATNVGLVNGTGTNCATGQSKITPAYALPANGGVSDQSAYGTAMYTPASNALCINTSAGNAVMALIHYSQQ